MQVPNGTGPGVRSKRPLLASRTRCNVLWKPPKFGNKVKIGIKVQFGNKFANRCNVWLIEGVIVYGHVPECHVTFGRGRLHNVWWDPHIDHKNIYERAHEKTSLMAFYLQWCYLPAITTFARMSIFQNGIQLLAFCIFIVWGIILLKWNFSTIRKTILRLSENMRYFHKGGFPMDPLIYVMAPMCRRTEERSCTYGRAPNAIDIS